MGQAGASVICRGRHITNLRFACQLSRFASAVRFSSRSEMLASRAKLVHCSRFAPAAQPQVSSSRAAPRRSVSIARSAQAEATTRIHGRSRSARIANTLVAVFNRAMSPQATAKTRCLTIRSTGHFVACGCWASFHSRPTAACHKMPVSSNVRQRQCKPCHRQLASPNSLSWPRWACQIQTTLSAIHSVFRSWDKLARLSSVVGATSPTCALLAN